MTTNWHHPITTVKFVAFVLTWLVCVAPTLADTHYANVSNAVPQFPYTNWADAAISIQAAVDFAVDGDMVLVTNGTYALTNTLSIAKAVTVKSVNGPSVTVINGNYPAYSIRCLSLSGTNTVEGFTITNGYLTAAQDGWSWGAGVICGNGSVLRRCLITGNRVATALATTVHGGGLFVGGGGKAQSCLIVGNRVSCLYTHGVGAYVAEGGIAENCTIVGNLGDSRTKGGGVTTSGGIVRNCIVFNNTGYYPYENFYNLGGTFVFNYVGDPGCVNPAGGDYHLQPSAAAVNAGNSAVLFPGTDMDLDGNPRVMNGDIDMGCYECSPGGMSALSWYEYQPASFILTASLALSNMDHAVYSWDFENDGTIDACGEGFATVTNLVLEAGCRPISITLSNAAGQSTNIVRRILTRPTVFFDASPTSAPAPATVIFTGRVDWSETNGLVYDWNVDVARTVMMPGSGAIITNTYVNGGFYTVSLTVSNAAGKIARTTKPSYILMTPLEAHYQDYLYTTNNGAITISKYIGTNTVMTIPDRIEGLPVTGIGGSAFSFCQLTSVIILSNVTSIGDSAFYHSTSLTSVTLPSSITSIGRLTFESCSGLASVTIPGGVTNIGMGAFYQCTTLTNVTLPSSITSIGGNAFYQCSALTSVTLPSSITSIEGSTFAFCSSLTNVTIPDTVTSIGAAAFDHCSKLISVTIPNSVIVIGYYAFDHCSSLTSITIPDSVTSIGDNAFFYCTSLSSAIVGDGLTALGNNIFYYCSSLTNIIIGASVSVIGDQAFHYCYSLPAFTVDAANSFYTSVDGVLLNKSETTIIQYPIGKCGDYSIPSTVTNIGYKSFDHCYGLTSVTIPNSVSIPPSIITLGDYAFSYCTNLTSATIGGGVAIIGFASFDHCTSMTNVSLPDSVTNIWGAAFSYCFQLTSVVIPRNVTKLGSSVFLLCTNLTSIYFRGDAPSIGTVTFGSPTTVYYLQNTTGWGTFGYSPTVLWNPQVLSDGDFGVGTNGFGFTFTNAGSPTIVVEACTNLMNPDWFDAGTNTLTGGSSYFSDPDWTNDPTRFYRFRAP